MDAAEEVEYEGLPPNVGLGVRVLSDILLPIPLVIRFLCFCVFLCVFFCLFFSFFLVCVCVLG